MKTIEDLIDETGGMGRFQWINTILIVSCQYTIGWSMLQMSYAGLIPDFRCVFDDISQSIENVDQGSQSIANVDDGSRSIANETLNICSQNGTRCSRYEFHGSDWTVMTEWELVCDKESTKKMIISIQMTGVLIGALLAGQMAERFGRKKSLYFFVFVHAALNILTAFSTSWEIFTVFRFFLGIGMGAILAIVLPYMMEFLPIKWRPLLGIMPSWTIGVGIFSIACLTLKNWSHLHIACGLFSIPSACGCLFVPESIRWLAIKGRIKEANKIIEKMAITNRKPLPENSVAVLQQVMLKETQSREESKKYSYIDLFKGFRMTKNTLILCFFWFSLSTVFYGISFGVASLSGNIYLNMFLLGILDIPVQTTTFCLNNRFGRRSTSIFFFSLSAFSCIGCLLSYYLASDDVQGPAINAFSLTAKMMAGAAWSAVTVWGPELYPTVTRSLSYGFSNTGARVGGLLAPYIIDLSDRMGLSYCIMSGLFVGCVFLCLFLEETRGTVLEESLPNNVEAGTNEINKDIPLDDDVGNGNSLIYKGKESDVHDKPDKL